MEKCQLNAKALLLLNKFLYIPIPFLKIYKSVFSPRQIEHWVGSNDGFIKNYTIDVRLIPEMHRFPPDTHVITFKRELHQFVRHQISNTL